MALNTMIHTVRCPSVFWSTGSSSTWAVFDNTLATRVRNLPGKESVQFTTLCCSTPMSSEAITSQFRNTPLLVERNNMMHEHQIEESKLRMGKFIAQVEAHEDLRPGANPYYLLHEAGDLVYGTVLIFHGFSESPKQCFFLAQYLFENGFNVYQPALAGQCLGKPDKNWPRLDLKPQWKEPILQKFFSDSVLSEALESPNPFALRSPDELMQRLLSLSPDMMDIVSTINTGDHVESFQRYFDSSHLRYLREAEEHLEEVSALPGPVFTVGISVGGAVALSLAVAHPDKISKAVAYAPFVKGINEAMRQFILLTGPLDLKKTGWDPALQFTLACVAAIDVFGSRLRQQSSLETLSRIPTFTMYTENEDAVDVAASQEFLANLVALSAKTGIPHFGSTYEKLEKVPHPMVHPTQVSQGMTNKYWATLYQETFRFLTQGVVIEDQLHCLQVDKSMPRVPSV